MTDHTLPQLSDARRVLTEALRQQATNLRAPRGFLEDAVNGAAQHLLRLLDELDGPAGGAPDTATRSVSESTGASPALPRVPEPDQALTEAEREVPLDVRRGLMACAIGNGHISYHWLCQLYTRGRADAQSERVLYRGTLVGLLPVCDATPGPLADQIKRFINHALRAARAGAEAPLEQGPALMFRCVDAVHVFASPRPTRCQCGRWDVTVMEAARVSPPEAPQ